ncbi:hypothetical protein B0A48_11380 [Cryoendolithus antarcticus]|uniref:Uncharacterized protein n=1 Tax=Cryoendolithus antarcticus TaxID=1507870 RepID=A0A1V8SVC0_9PEZI|nr:hypothetical protein B0A48_11380 [Cryoendolithus antarcticus]
MATTAAQSVDRPLNLIPVGLKEAALDSPTFRATALHFAEQIEQVERWLEGYVRAASKLVIEVSALETLINGVLAQSSPPAGVSEAVLDHDYTLLALMRYGEGAREFWNTTLRGVKKYDNIVVEPIKSFLSNELKAFKDVRRALETAQKNFDGVISRYLGQNKSKEASSLREDAFQVHEARKAYLKAAMDFCVLSPQLRFTLDKLLVKVFSEQWKEMRLAREANTPLFSKWNGEMDRVRGWSKEMEESERAFKRELATARRQIEDSAEHMWRPARELESYSASTVPYLGTGTSGPNTAPSATSPGLNKAEKQGWLFIKTLSGKPTRTVWSRRWFFVKNGIFGWLVQGARSGGVEESEKIGVLLCSVRPAFQEERRFCFDVKTKNTSIILQAETQAELTEWISAFEMAKRKALQDPASTEASGTVGVDPAFAISPPVAPELAAKVEDRHARDASDDMNGLAAPERAETTGGIANRASFDVNPNRRVTSLERGEGEGTREHAARIIQKLDLHKRSAASSSGGPQGIASLISASHNILPVGPGAPAPTSGETPYRSFTMSSSSLAPSTLANPPAATNLSHTAVVISGERDLGRMDGSAVPSGILANLWGTTAWGYVNKLGEDGQMSQATPASASEQPGTGIAPTTVQDDLGIMDGESENRLLVLGDPFVGLGSLAHRKTMSTADIVATATPISGAKEPTNAYPNYYPLALKVQQAQFRMLFPSLVANDKVVLVFRATWNPNEQQDFPGRVYVTTKAVYFYSHHLGLVLTTSVDLSSIEEVTAAPGRDCDFMYLHLKDNNSRIDELRRITIKIFLEPLRLLQRRLSYLVHNAAAERPSEIEEVLKTLIRMEGEDLKRSSSVESWEDVRYTPDEGATGQLDSRRPRNVKASLHVDGNLYGEPNRTGKEIQKFKLPSSAVQYAPQGMRAFISRDSNVSAKALFHVVFGDKSAVFQLLYCNRWGADIVQSPWTKPDGAAHWIRHFSSDDPTTPMNDIQTIDIYNDHLCYVVTNVKRPWRLPFANRFTLTSKIVITHSAKSRCKLAVYQQIRWSRAPRPAYFQRLIETYAFNNLEADALDLTNVAMDQVAKLGNHSKTNKAVDIFGAIGVATQPTRLDSSAAPTLAVLKNAKQARRQTLPGMVLDDALQRLVQLFYGVFDVLIAISKSVISVCNAHSILVLLLAASFAYNTWYGYRDSYVWYNERSAAKFVARLGVTPSPVMARAVYVSDIEEFVTPNLDNVTALAFGSDGVKTCRSTFGQQLTPALVSTDKAYRSDHRLSRTRDAIARYRHDLLVALRVVNRVEKDVVLAEYDTWVREEAAKCEKMRNVLRGREKARSKAKSKEQQVISSKERGVSEEMERYCGSCNVELARVKNGTSLL